MASQKDLDAAHEYANNWKLKKHNPIDLASDWAIVRSAFLDGLEYRDNQANRKNKKEISAMIRRRKSLQAKSQG